MSRQRQRRPKLPRPGSLPKPRGKRAEAPKARVARGKHVREETMPGQPGWRARGLLVVWIAAAVALVLGPPAWTRAVIIVGNQHLDAPTIVREAAISPLSNVFLVDDQAAAAQLRADVWVRDSAVSSLYPASVQITVQEWHPAALWQAGGRLYLLNPRGQVLRDLPSGGILQTVPVPPTPTLLASPASTPSPPSPAATPSAVATHAPGGRGLVPVPPLLPRPPDSGGLPLLLDSGAAGAALGIGAQAVDPAVLNAAVLLSPTLPRHYGIHVLAFAVVSPAAGGDLVALTSAGWQLDFGPPTRLQDKLDALRALSQHLDLTRTPLVAVSLRDPQRVVYSTP